MKYLYIILSVIAIITLLIITIKSILKKVNIYIIKINEAEKNIDILLEKKMETLTKIKERLKEKIDEGFMLDLAKIKNQSLDSFELDAEEEKLERQLKESLEFNKKIILDDDDNVLVDLLKKTSLDLKATKNYYNDNCEIYNSIISKFPTIIISKIKGYEPLDFYETKQEEEFEILKNKK